jgi:DNA repair exonuclease SbcCD ATPase subunit
LVNYLPNRSSLLSETAPPPKNPRLQYCLEEYAEFRFGEDGDQIRAAIAKARTLDLGGLPENIREALEDSVENAENAIPNIETIVAAKAAIAEATPEYRPLHRFVRALERDARKFDEKIEELQVTVNRSGDAGIFTAERGEEARAEILTLEAQRDALLAQIPDDWDPRHDTFLELQAVEIAARRTYRRTVDDAYDPLVETIALIEDRGLLEAKGDALNALPGQLQSLTPEQFMETVATLREELGEIEGVGDIRSALNKARREMRGDEPDVAAAAAEITEAIAAFDTEVTWRSQAADGVLPGLREFDAAIAKNIGLRGQDRLPRDQALFVARCNAEHRDVSLSF